eukprot:g34122.t1
MTRQNTGKRWCLVVLRKDNNLSLNISKTKELIIDFRKQGRAHASIYINGAEVEMVESIKFLAVTITSNLPWTTCTDATVGKAQQHVFFLRRLKKLGMSMWEIREQSSIPDDYVCRECDQLQLLFGWSS